MYEIGNTNPYTGPSTERAFQSPGVQPMNMNVSSALAVVVTCHQPYVRWLSEALESIDRQVPSPAERVVVLDACSPGNLPGSHWSRVTGNWQHPSLTRNAGLAATTSPWIVFWDADNVMPEGYIAGILEGITSASASLAILYPDIHYCDERLAPQWVWHMPDWDYWGMRAQNCVDTASAWRREALELVGGWPVHTDGGLEDYLLAMEVTGAGWKATRANAPPVLMRTHSNSRQARMRAQGEQEDTIWRSRSLAIVSLLAGREEVLRRWLSFLREAELPRKAALYVVDNSGRSTFTRRARDLCQSVAEERRLSHLDYAIAGEPYQPSTGEPYFIRDRHLHVAQLYASILPRVTEDLVITLEDDVQPPPDALRRLGAQIGWRSEGRRVAAVAGAYELPQDSALVCAGLGREEWGACLSWSQLSDQPREVGCAGGGCTVWANWALRELPVHFWWQAGLGWDGALCIELRRNGYQIQLHGGVRCKHHLHGRLIAQPPSGTARILGQMENLTRTSSKAGSQLPERESPAVAVVDGRSTGDLIRHEDSWIPLEQLGSHIPPYRPTYAFEPFINSRHRMYASAPLQEGWLIDLGIPGWLRREDALKLYELAYFASGDILEIGAYHGLSTAILAAAVEDSGSRNSVVSIDLLAANVAAARSNLTARDLGRNVRFLIGDCIDSCGQLLQDGRHFSLAFIDHSHYYDDVLNICRLLPQLLVEGGFCLFHDSNDKRNQDPNNRDYGVLQAVMDGLNRDTFLFYGNYGCCGLFRYMTHSRFPANKKEQRGSSWLSYLTSRHNHSTVMS